MHRVLRTLFSRAPGLVVEAGADPERHAIVDAHLEEIMRALHSHHEGEDLTLWDRLESRRPACAIHVSQMRAQHAEIGTLLRVASDAHSNWRKNRAAGASALAEALSAVNDSLNAHLTNEEAFVPEAASELISQVEWEEMRKHGMADIPKDRLLLQLGFMLREFESEKERAEFWRHVPLAAKVMYRLFGARQLTRELTLLYGTER